MNQKEVIQRLIYERKKQKLSASEIAKRIGVSRSTINRVEKNPQEDVRYSIVEAYANALGFEFVLIVKQII
jgi:transcriptional regulator with XRE-family HTH domain